MPGTNRFVFQATFGFLLVGFLALLGIVGMTFWLGERAQLYFNDVIEARDTRSSAGELRSAVQTAESSQRGFVLTGNEIYLAPYDSAKAAAERQLETLRAALASDRESDRMVERLTTIVTEKFAEMDETIALKRDRRSDEALAMIRSNRGKALADEANVFFSGIIRAADERLTAGVGEQRANARLLRTVSMIGAVIIVVVVASAAFTILGYTRALRAARDEVTVLNAGLEERVKARTAELEEASEEMRRFTHIVSHDLRAPLISIVGFTSEIENGVGILREVVDRSDPSDPLAESARAVGRADLPEAIGFVRSSARKMEGLINAILKLSREGRRTPQLEVVDLAELIDTSLAAIRHQVDAAAGEVTLDICAPAIVGDRLMLEQILGNLLDNAVKYRDQSRPLRISVRATPEPGDRIAIEIADNGRGIAAADLERVFDLFHRAGPKDMPGEGIGLAFVKRTVRHLGGKIGVASPGVGEGTTFRILLPRTPDAGIGSPRAA